MRIYKKYVTVILSFLVIMWFIYSLMPVKRISFVDVGFGDASIIELSGALYVIDFGSDFELDMYLGQKYPMFCKLNYVFLTHPHKDHIGGFEKVARRCKIDVVFHNRVPFDSETYTDVLSLLENKLESPIYEGMRLPLSDNEAYFYTLWPSSFTLENGVSNVNNISTVLLFDYYDFEVLFMGDIESDASDLIPIEDYIHLIDDGLDVLKVPHHGSIDSLNKELLLLLKPKHAVISVGENSFGHPSKEHIDYLEEIGATVWRTDIHGNVQFRF